MRGFRNSGPSGMVSRTALSTMASHTVFLAMAMSPSDLCLKTTSSFNTYYLDIAPYPMTVPYTLTAPHRDRTFFAKLHGYLPALPNVTDASLADATFNVMMYGSFENGREHTWGPATVPLRAQMIAKNHGYLAIRNKTGHYVEHLSLGYNDILVDGMYVFYFTTSGNHTFAFDARLPDGRCLFAFEMTQWFHGGVGCDE
ncbi:hypothetical protein LTR95_005544 [Oleoguttula sp. CCFEE 5521]